MKYSMEYSPKKPRSLQLRGSSPRNNCSVEFLESDLSIGKHVKLYYSPLEENHGNGILTSPVVNWKLHEENGEDMYILETQNSIFSMKLLE